MKELPKKTGPKPLNRAKKEILEINAQRQKRYRARKQKETFVEGELAVECWCTREIVHVLPEDIQKGLTKSCGLSTCHQ